MTSFMVLQSVRSYFIASHLIQLSLLIALILAWCLRSTSVISLKPSWDETCSAVLPNYSDIKIYNNNINLVQWIIVLGLSNTTNYTF